jgi:enamine deaminase RidA (YjgF/YER057c/UK114 family)
MTETAARHNPTTVWSVPEPFRGIYSHAVELVAGTRMVFISGQIGVAPDGTLNADFDVQCEQAMDNVEALLAATRMTRANMVKVTYFLTRPEDYPRLGQIRRRRWAEGAPPAVTALIVAALARPECLVEIEVVAAAR